MESLRLDGIKYEHPTRAELENIHGHLLIRHAALIGDIALVESILYPVQDEQLQIDFEAQATEGF